MTVSLIVVLGILMLIGAISGGGFSATINRYSTASYNEKLQTSLVLSSMLTLFGSIAALAWMCLSPFNLLLPYFGPPVFISTIILNLLIIRKQD